MSNRLKMVLDATNSSQGFTDNANATATDIDFRYDALGNMIADNNKGITSIKYNHLNLPVEIIFNNDAYKKITYLYNATGEKVQKTIKYSATILQTYDYFDGYQYRNNILLFFPTREGYVSNTFIAGNNYYNYIFNYTDHLGNVRLSYSKESTTELVKTLEENHYYPFGLKHTGYNSNLYAFQAKETGIGVELIDMSRPIPGNLLYQYKYNGMEWQEELSLNLYDMDRRDYDPATARWLGIDPVAHFDQSTYMAMNGNPVVYADPSGADGVGMGNVGGEIWSSSWGSTYSSPYNGAGANFSGQYGGLIDPVRMQKDSNFTTYNPKEISNILSHYSYLSGGSTITWWGTNTDGQYEIGYNKSKTKDSRLDTVNMDYWEKVPEVAEAFIAGKQLSMFDARQSMPIMDKIGNYSKFAAKYQSLSRLGAVLGRINTGLNIYSTIRDYNDPQVNSKLFTYIKF